MTENPNHAPQQQPAVNDRCCDALAKALAEAKRGQWQTAALILVGADGQPMIYYGGRGEDTLAVNFGCDLIKEQLIARTAAPSTILRPGTLKQ